MKKKKFLIRKNKLLKFKLKFKNLHSYKKYRLVILRTNKHIYAQIINFNGNTVVSASSLELFINNNTNNKNKKELSNIVGEVLAKRALNKKIKQIFFDRSGYIYHGRIKCLAKTLRLKGLFF